MSFLSRGSSRSDQRGSRAGARRRTGSEYDDYDYAPDNYQQDDDNWSPDEYFSPAGINGNRAVGSYGDRPSGQGRRDGDRGYDHHGRGDYGSGDYGPGDYGPGPQRGRGPAGRYGRDSHAAEDRYGPGDYGPGDYGPGGGEYGTGAYEMPEGFDDDRGGRKRRDRGERGERGERWRRLGRRDKEGDIWPDDGVSDEDYWASVAADRPLNSANPALDGDRMNVVNNRPLARPNGAAAAGQVRLPGEARTGAGRLGPAPGMAGYLSGSQSGSTSGPMARSATGPAASRSGTGPTATPAATGATPAARPGIDGRTGPNAGRPGSGTGPNAARPGTGPTAARPSAGLAQPGLTQPGLTQPSLPQLAPAQPSFQPHAAARGSGRQPEVPDWAERTERIDRVAPAGYPDPRLTGRGQAAGAGNGRRSTDDDPLTSKKYSREELVNTDGRSYRFASQRAQVSAGRYAAALTENTQTFSMNGQYTSDPQAPAVRYPARGGQQPGQQAALPGHGSAASAAPRNPYDRGTGSYPYPSQPYPSRTAAARDQDENRYPQPARPGGYDVGYNASRNGGGGHNGHGRYTGNGGYPGGHGDGRGGSGRY